MRGSTVGVGARLSSTSLPRPSHFYLLMAAARGRISAVVDMAALCSRRPARRRVAMWKAEREEREMN